MMSYGNIEVGVVWAFAWACGFRSRIFLSKGWQLCKLFNGGRVTKGLAELTTPRVDIAVLINSCSDNKEQRIWLEN